MNSKDLKQLDQQAVMQTYGRFDLAIEKAEGSTLYDFEGKAYVDFTSGIGVNSIGYNNQKWIDAITKQASLIQHTSNIYYTAPSTLLAVELTEKTGMKSAFFANSGAESNEGVIKCARKYSFDKYGQDRYEIITLENSFHGRTISTLAATAQDHFHNYFFPFTQGFVYAKANIEAIKAKVSESTCAIMMELIQGEGGVLPLDMTFVKEVEALCKEKDILLIIDEVQTGVGRTGSLFAFQQYEIKPDLLSFAKGIGGGLPLGGFLANEKCSTVLGAGTHATTFGGNPIACAGALEVLNQVNDALLSDVKDKGEYITSKINSWGFDFVSQARGLGLMIAIPLVSVSHKEVAVKCIEDGLLVLTAGKDALRLLPPLTISYADIDKGLSILKKVLESFK